MHVCAARSLAGWVILVNVPSPLHWRAVGDEPAQVHPVWELATQQRQHVGIEEEVEIGDLREVRLGADAEVVLAEPDLNTLPWSRVFPNPGADCPLRVEQGAESATGSTPCSKRSRQSPNELSWKEAHQAISLAWKTETGSSPSKTSVARQWRTRSSKRARPA